MTAFDIQKLAERLAPLYVDDFVGVAKLCDETIDPSGALLGIVRSEAAKIGLTPSCQKAREVLDRLCSDPQMWATHGRPNEYKMKRLEDELAAAFEANPSIAELSTEADELRSVLVRCRTVLGNMAKENDGAIFRRWPIDHEPLRSDARNLLPIIDNALRRY